jgi:histidinol-phosphate aminotransferase
MREQGQRELVRLGANESAFGPSPRAVEAMAAGLGRLSWYGDPESLDLRDALARKHGCDPGQIVVTAGIDDAMGLAVRAFAAPGSSIVTTRGTYPTLTYHAIGFGAVPAFERYRDDGRLDLGALASAAARLQPAIVYVANPDNPSGTLLEREALEAFLADLPDATLLLLDEAYADFVDETELLAPRYEDRVIRLRTFSKAYGLAGARIGYALTSAANVRTFQKIRLQYGVNRNAQIGALASLQDDGYRDWVVAETEEARADYYALAAELGIAAIPSRANFVCLDMGTAARAELVLGALLERGVWIRKPGAPPLDRYVRVSAGTPPMRAAFADALRATLDEVPG